MPRKTAADLRADRPRRPHQRHDAEPGNHRRGHREPPPLPDPLLGLDAALPRGRCEDTRGRIACEAARIMAEQGEPEFERARRKAAARSGVTDRRSWPDNAEIEAALQAHYRLFHGERQQQVTTDLRERALAAMTALAAFEPRLVGRAVAGTATREQGIQLHLFADDPAEVIFTLIDRGIRFEERDALVRYTGGINQTHPALAMLAGEVPVELILLPRAAQRNPPLSPVTERPERGLRAAEVERLLARGDAPL